ncbi:hypothetical protein PTTW11_10820 [Pyrenophora teres f. teres]|uniref:Uncharacterized protein n=1 Tax=Pyrenophora teres f. teres TaxID=97479 RepID=A0A6S6WH10_9PLEO|nr:hypothetical protein PTTW11_10820 [Pyrenophora teres f. teres]
MAPPQPPPAISITDKARKGFQALAANQEKRSAMRKNAETSRYFDGSAPMTRRRRQQVRAYYEVFVQSCYQITAIEEIWDRSEFITRTKEFLEGVTHVAEGKFEEKIKTATLWSYKHALYWWASVLVQDFQTIWHNWHCEVSRHIHMLSVHQSLSLQSWKKNNLSDSELCIIFQHICDQRYGMENLKQHWAAMVMVWLTAARPGSFTVSCGYQAGEPLGVPGMVRDTSSTLRWSDVQFFHMVGGIAVKITFRHIKGYQNPHKDGSLYGNAEKAFTFLPSSGERLEFDLPIILFGIAYQRGLFVQTLEVFVAANQAGRIDQTKPMIIHALNAKLQQLCTGIGLLERNSYYSLRRTAIIEVKRDHGTEKAKDLAFHVASSNSLIYYDNIGFGDLDMGQFRLGGPESVSREEIQKYFSQANLTKWQPIDDEAPTLTQSINQATKDQLREEPEYISREQNLKRLYDETGDQLQELQAAGRIPDNEKIPTGCSVTDGAKLKALSHKYGLDELTKKIEEQLVNRKRAYRSIRLRLRKSIVQELRRKHRATLLESQHQSMRKCSAGGAYEPQILANAAVSGLDHSTTEASLMVEISDSDPSHSDDEDDCVDAEVLERENDASREEPECWTDLESNVQIQIGGGEASAETSEIRKAFLLKWIGMTDTVVAQSNLVCPRCQIDPTMKATEKQRRFTLFRLNTHMRGQTHSREAQLRRALKIDGHTKTSTITCPVCKLPWKGISAFMRHLKVRHADQLWDGIEGESEPEDITDFEGFSDTGDGVMENDGDQVEVED